MGNRTSPSALEQTRAAAALVKFIRDHAGQPDPDLVACLVALERGDSAEALRKAAQVKPHGMGGLTDWWPPAKFPNEDEQYVSSVLQALVNEWCRLMNALAEAKT